MALNIPALLEGILEATASEAAAKARLARLRAALEDEARRRYEAEGAAPSWNTPTLGKVRLEPPSAWTATLSDPVEFGSWVAENHPTEATAMIPVAATDLADVLQALEFIGAKPAGEVRVEVRSAWEEAYIKNLTVDLLAEATEESPADFIVTDADGLMPPGVIATQKPAKLVVTLDRERRSAAVAEAQNSAAELVASAEGDDPDAPDPDALDTTRRELEALPAATLSTIAKGHGLGSSGTKAELAERIARAELATGKVIRTGAQVDTPEVVKYPHPVDLPADTFEPPTEEDYPEPPVKAHLNQLSREVLRGYAKSVGISAAGTKGDLLDRLVEAGTTVTDVNAYAHNIR